MVLIHSPCRQEQGITRLEAIVTLVCVALIAMTLSAGLTLYWQKHKSSAKTKQCMANLSLLGKAFSMYAADNGGRLPYGYIRYDNHNQSSWDTLLVNQVRRNLRPPGDPTPPTFAERVRVLQCPEDSLGKADWAQSADYFRRSYSMSEHDMSPENWPPGSRNTTGVGLWWNFGGKAELHPDPGIYNYDETNRQAAVRITDIIVPAGVLLLGEQINSNNLAFIGARATIATTANHLDAKAMAPESFHHGLFNYLMIDGQVQALSPEDTVGPSGKVGKDRKTHRGIWTIAPGD
jgi:hypothetical protein